MRNKPIVRKVLFGCDEDPIANSVALEAIFIEALKVQYDMETASFTSNLLGSHPWIICISDWHEDEKEPHYVLEVGSDSSSTFDDPGTLRAYRVMYCDYISTLSDGLSSVAQPDGYCRIDIWVGSEVQNDLMNSIAENVYDGYLASLRKAFPNIFTLSSQVAPLRKSE